MATVTKGRTFTDEEVTASKLNTLVDDATVTEIVNSDIAAAAAIAGTKIAPNFGTQTLITTGNIYSVTWADYSGSSTIAGWNPGPSGTIYTKKIGKVVFVSYTLTGTSNSTSTTFTVPYSVGSGVSILAPCLAVDNTGTAAFGRVSISTATVTLSPDAGGSNWTASGTKSIQGTFWYESA